MQIYNVADVEITAWLASAYDFCARVMIHRTYIYTYTSYIHIEIISAIELSLSKANNVETKYRTRKKDSYHLLLGYLA